MLRFIKILFCLSLYFSLQNEKVFAQVNVYHPFPDSNAVWRNRWTEICSMFASYGGPCHSPYQYVINGDTIFSGNTYHKLYNEGFSAHCNLDSTSQGIPYYSCTNSGSSGFSSGFCGGFRNDTSHKKVLFVSYTGYPEEVLYDFSLNIGDTLKSRVATGVVTNIDSILVDTKYRKRFTISNTLSIIEGIGAVDCGGNGIWAELLRAFPCTCPYAWNFVCFSQNGNFMYGDTNCTILNSTQEILHKTEEVNIYPNPNSGEFTFDAKLNKGHLIVYNVIGEKVFETNVESRPVRINLLQGGVYHLCFTTIEGVFTKKIIISK